MAISNILPPWNLLMNPLCRRPLRRLSAGLTLLVLAGAAHAQYVWIDAKGLRQYSDRPPPPSTPAHKILKAPGRLPPVAAVPDTPAPATPSEKANSAPTLAERDAAFRKRAQERAEQERKEADEARRKADLAERCAAARETRAHLDSGIRIAKVGADGERAFLTDEERAARRAQANRVLEACR